MKANAEQTKNQTAVQTSQESAWKHVTSFAVMIVLTAIAFAAVATNLVPSHLLVPLLLTLAAVQVVVQLYTFMHLNQKGSGFPVAFMASGIFIGVISAVALMILV
ncbi:hypothetical protein GCM10011571_31340 [Marinithermofilum abyssi]|uniref:Cytochrome c oxidase subunit 4 n=1 Tax=Marinithermofilum abyssi TaxID=1571185 RepID=A0A8J2YEN5_9BACL|nr:cytochrome C oxidase subunit IV family protein [Marinithermofilum abyssi]GGE26863.1 hypothetical protein GCM10011571_31340 [Marinithermofilum abyssi]